MKKIFLFLFCFSSFSFANYLNSPKVQSFINLMVSKHNFQKEELEYVFSQAKKQESIIKAISRSAEQTKPWHQYRKVFITEKRIQDGREFVEQNYQTLLRAQDVSGVPYQIIAAIIGVETSYGKNMGSYRVIDSLSTLAFDYPRRSDYFIKELTNFLLLTRNQGFDPLSLKGSYAGAMGYGQFMPSSFLHYAVDFDGDGVIDIWTNVVDAIGSVANFLQKHGWNGSQNIIALKTEAHPNAKLNCVVSKVLKPTLTNKHLLDCGIVPKSNLNANVFIFENENEKEFWLGYNNFYTITRYNLSNMYALAVFQLSEYLKK